MILTFYTLIALIASIQDIRTRNVSDLVHILIILIAIPSLCAYNILGGIIGGLLFLAPNFKCNGSMGGADIKFMFASGLLLGSIKITIATIIGLIVAIVFTKLSNFILKKDEKRIAYIPYLSIGCIIAFLI